MPTGETQEPSTAASRAQAQRAFQVVGWGCCVGQKSQKLGEELAAAWWGEEGGRGRHEMESTRHRGTCWCLHLASKRGTTAPSLHPFRSQANSYMADSSPETYRKEILGIQLKEPNRAQTSSS